MTRPLSSDVKLNRSAKPGAISVHSRTEPVDRSSGVGSPDSCGSFRWLLSGSGSLVTGTASLFGSRTCSVRSRTEPVDRFSGVGAPDSCSSFRWLLSGSGSLVTGTASLFGSRTCSVVTGTVVVFWPYKAFQPIAPPPTAKTEAATVATARWAVRTLARAASDRLSPRRFKDRFAGCDMSPAIYRSLSEDRIGSGHRRPEARWRPSFGVTAVWGAGSDGHVGRFWDSCGVLMLSVPAGRWSRRRRPAEA